MRDGRRAMPRVVSTVERTSRIVPAVFLVVAPSAVGKDVSTVRIHVGRMDARLKFPKEMRSIS